MKRTRIQISSGQGPLECELAVGKLVEVICRNGRAKMEESVRGGRPGCLKSAVLCGGEELLEWLGTVQWICQSPFRPKHRRKNWFVSVSLCSEAEQVEFDCGLVRFETFRSSGNGGQNVNKVESGVRAVYTPTGQSAVSVDERSQYRNKQRALARVRKLVEEENREKAAAVVSDNWRQHTRLERGNAVKVYRGIEFRRQP